MPTPVSEAGLRIALSAYATALLGGELQIFEAEDVAGERALARPRIRRAEYAAPDALLLEFVDVVGLRRGRAARFRLVTNAGETLLSEQVGTSGSGAALELSRIGVEKGGAVRIRSAQLRWPQPAR